ncbi:hypothetical protein KFU94_20455 [Chloroflexi bacterium TSY]|nr:hypothetical protein [Chloroflexi bacterium TSY]
MDLLKQISGEDSVLELKNLDFKENQVNGPHRHSIYRLLDDAELKLTIFAAKSPHEDAE